MRKSIPLLLSKKKNKFLKTHKAKRVFFPINLSPQNLLTGMNKVRARWMMNKRDPLLNFSYFGENQNSFWARSRSPSEETHRTSALESTKPIHWKTRNKRVILSLFFFYYFKSSWLSVLTLLLLFISFGVLLLPVSGISSSSLLSEN
jgi:hypothetical protein